MRTTKDSWAARNGSLAVEGGVMVILVGLAVGLLMPAVADSQDEAKKVACQQHLQRLGKAIAAHEQANRYLPSGWYHPGDAHASSAYAGAFTHLLPYLEQEALFNNYDQTKSWWDKENQKVVNTRIEWYECPSSPGDHKRQGLRKLGGESKVDEKLSAAVGDYWILRGYIEDRLPRADQRVIGALMPLSDDGAIKRQHDILPRYELITDGRSCTLMLGEKGGQPDYYVLGKKQETEATFGGFNEPWSSYSSAWVRNFSEDGMKYNWSTGPCVINCQNGYGALYSFHPKGANFLYADGSIRFLHETITVDVMHAMLSRAGGEILSPEDFSDVK